MADSDDKKPKSAFQKLLEALGLTREEYNELSDANKDAFLKPIQQVLLEDKVQRGIEAILTNPDLEDPDRSFVTKLLTSRQAGTALNPDDTQRLAGIIIKAANGKAGGGDSSGIISM